MCTNLCARQAAQASGGGWHDMGGWHGMGGMGDMGGMTWMA